MSRDLPARPNLEFLKKQAKALLDSGDAGPTLTDAQHALAREYGFATWAKLKAHVDAIAGDANPGELLRAAIRTRDPVKVQTILDRHPALVGTIDQAIPGGDFGATALLTAVDAGSIEVVDVLLRAGADINVKSHWPPGGFGVLDPGSGLVPLLIERGARVDAYDASRNGMMDRLVQLVASDPAAVHLRGGDGQTPLHVAPTVEIARFLVDHGADIDAVDVDHESTPAQYLIRDHPDVVRFLVSRGCRTDILLAAALGDAALLRRHLDADPESIRTVVTDEYFPMKGRLAAATIYNWTLDWFASPHAIAREFGHEDAFRLLIDRSPPDVAAAADAGDAALVTRLLKGGPPAAGTLGAVERRKLVRAACNNKTETVRLLLKAGWPLDERGKDDGTALHWAAFNGNAAMVRDLLAHHAPVHVRDKQYDGVPIHWAIYGSVHAGDKTKTGDYGAVVEALLDAGAAVPPLPDAVEMSGAVREVLRRRAEARGG